MPHSANRFSAVAHSANGGLALCPTAPINEEPAAVIEGFRPARSHAGRAGRYARWGTWWAGGRGGPEEGWAAQGISTGLPKECRWKFTLAAQPDMRV